MSFPYKLTMWTPLVWMAFFTLVFTQKEGSLELTVVVPSVWMAFFTLAYWMEFFTNTKRELIWWVDGHICLSIFFHFFSFLEFVINCLVNVFGQKMLVLLCSIGQNNFWWPPKSRFFIEICVFVTWYFGLLTGPFWPFSVSKNQPSSRPSIL